MQHDDLRETSSRAREATPRPTPAPEAVPPPRAATGPARPPRATHQAPPDAGRMPPPAASVPPLTPPPYVPPIIVNVATGGDKKGLLRRIVEGLVTGWMVRIALSLFFFGMPAWIPLVLGFFGYERGDSVHHAIEEAKKRAEEAIKRAKEEAAELARRAREEADERKRQADVQIQAAMDKVREAKEHVADKVATATSIASLLPKPSLPSFGRRDPHAGERSLGGGWYIRDDTGPIPPGAPPRGSADEIKQLRDRERKYDAYREEAMLRTAAMSGIVGNPSPPAYTPPAYTPPPTYSSGGGIGSGYGGYGGYYNGPIDPITGKPPAPLPEPLPDAPAPQ